MVAICVDAGTSVVKAVAFDEDGIEIAIARQSVGINRAHPGWSEQDMQAVKDATFTTIRQVANDIKDNIHFLAITAQGDGCWLIDKHGHPTGPAILWNDGRAASLVNQWEQDGITEKAFRQNGTLAFPGSQSAILRWLYEHDRDRVERSAMALYCKDWIILNLTGIAGTDESDGSFPFFDIQKRQYSNDLMQLYGIEWAERLLASVHPNTIPIGELQTEAAHELGLPAGIPVIAAPYDVAATAIGLGAVEPGQAVSILGTTLCNEIVVDQVNTAGTPSGLLICSGVPGRWLRGFATMCGTEAITWLCRFLGDIQPAQLTELASHIGPGAGGVTFLPYMSPAGERAPFLNPNARGTLFGLSLEQSREYVARAILEGLSYIIRECFEASQTTPTMLNVCGGGAVSDVWCQIITDITKIPVRTSADAELGAKGALLTGLVATGQYNNIATVAQQYSKTRKLYEPDATMVERYETLYHHFITLRDIAAEAWLQQAQIRHQLDLTSRPDKSDLLL
jgi:erythritol kinase